MFGLPCKTSAIDHPCMDLFFFCDQNADDEFVTDEGKGISRSTVVLTICDRVPTIYRQKCFWTDIGKVPPDGPSLQIWSRLLVACPR